MKTAMTSLNGDWFLLTSHPEKLYPAEFLGEGWNVGGHPNVTMDGLAKVLLAVIADPGGKYRGFAILTIDQPQGDLELIWLRLLS